MLRPGFGTAAIPYINPKFALNNVRRDMPPFLFIHGTADHLVPFEQSRAMCERMKAAGATCELYPVQNAGHGIRWWESTDRAAGYKREMVRWLRQQLTPGAHSS
jgi:dipeptidyl aminopeptidase/acylaminoacyl peptidase